MKEPSPGEEAHVLVDVVEDEDCPAPPLLRPPLRLSFDRKEEFTEKEELDFPPLANAGRY